MKTHVTEEPIRETSASVPSSPKSIPLTVEVFRDLKDLQRIKNEWTALQQHPNCDFDFYSGVVSSTDSILRPHVIVVSRDGSPITMLVGRIDRGTVDFNIGYKKLFGFAAKNLTFLHGGFVGEKSTEISRVLIDSLSESLRTGEADVCYFNHLRVDEDLFNQLLKISNRQGYLSRFAQRKHRGTSLAPSGEGYLKTLTSKERNNQKRRTKRILEDFPNNRIQCYQDPVDFERAVADIDQVAQKTYQRALGVAFSNTPEARRRLRNEMDRGWFRGYVLYLNDQPAAFWLGTAFGDTFYSGFTGYDPAWSKYAPGMYLLLKALELLCESNPDGRLKKTDFGLGDAEWKIVIGNQEWEEAPVSIFAPNSKGRLLRRTRWATEIFDAAAKRLLTRFQLLAKVKRLWRRELSAH
jgi:CelD/BcsL family acetyltransferase involved in cellulose biosynthesis